MDVVHNNRVIHRWNGFEVLPEPHPNRVKVHVEVGWGEKNENVDWDVSLAIENGELISVEPRFRGHEIVAPQAGEEESYAFTSWQHAGNQVQFKTRTWGNATTTTASTQGVCLEVDCTTDTSIYGVINGKLVTIEVGELLSSPRSVYLGAFLTPVCHFHRAVPASQYAACFEIYHESEGHQQGWYYIRVRQHNGQWAWSSPIWMQASGQGFYNSG